MRARETSCVGTMRALMPMLAIKVVPPKSTKMERAPSLMRRKAYSRKDSAPPITHNFCESSNRVRITCTGTLHTCLGHEDASDLRKPLRTSADNDLLSAAIDRAIGTSSSTAVYCAPPTGIYQADQ
jgi:molybdenum cofactor biosynthesis enzyme MoaA